MCRNFHGQKWKVCKLKFKLQLPWMHQKKGRGGGTYRSTITLTWSPCPLGKLPDNHCKGSWVTFRASVDGYRKSRTCPPHHRGSNSKNAQPVATGCTDYANPTANERYGQQKLKSYISPQTCKAYLSTSVSCQGSDMLQSGVMCSNLNDGSRYTLPHAGIAPFEIWIPWWCSTYLGLFRLGLNLHS